FAFPNHSGCFWLKKCLNSVSRLSTCGLRERGKWNKVQAMGGNDGKPASEMRFERSNMRHDEALSCGFFLSNAPFVLSIQPQHTLFDGKITTSTI
ncbi:hypothetical protein, partial [Breznakibacter xylanolyticus]|uniref:hypothetical protein n=1 Tax=Breznakibacter xylanolyticus TaxID=990 RepID=UPI001C8A1CF4